MAATYFITMGTIIIIASLVMTAGSWKMLEKMDESGWKALIPFYNRLVQYRRVWDESYLGLLFDAATVISVLLIIEIFTTGAAHTIALAVLFAIVFAVIANVVIFTYKLSKSFGHGVGFTFGMLVCPFVFLPIIGFGSSEYVGA